jgi:galactonate dehydratase
MRPAERFLAEPRVEVVDGYISVPERAGLGVELNTDEIAKHPYQQEHHLPLFKDGWEAREAQGNE